MQPQFGKNLVKITSIAAVIVVNVAVVVDIDVQVMRNSSLPLATSGELAWGNSLIDWLITRPSILMKEL